MSDFYWVAPPGDQVFSNPANWSASSGGAGGAGVPGSVDTAYADQAGSGNMHLDINTQIDSLIFLEPYDGEFHTDHFSLTIFTGLFSVCPGMDAYFYTSKIELVDAEIEKLNSSPNIYVSDSASLVAVAGTTTNQMLSTFIFSKIQVEETSKLGSPDRAGIFFTAYDELVVDGEYYCADWATTTIGRTTVHGGLLRIGPNGKTTGTSEIGIMCHPVTTTFDLQGVMENGEVEFYQCTTDDFTIPRYDWPSIIINAYYFTGTATMYLASGDWTVPVLASYAWGNTVDGQKIDLTANPNLTLTGKRTQFANRPWSIYLAQNGGQNPGQYIQLISNNIDVECNFSVHVASEVPSSTVFWTDPNLEVTFNSTVPDEYIQFYPGIEFDWQNLEFNMTDGAYIDQQQDLIASKSWDHKSGRYDKRYNDMTVGDCYLRPGASINQLEFSIIVVSGRFNWQGTDPNNLLDIKGAAEWTLNVVGDISGFASHVDVAYSNAAGGKPIYADDGTNVDSGVNFNWIFPPEDYWTPQDVSRVKEIIHHTARAVQIEAY